jgi:hypothetical protein
MVFTSTRVDSSLAPFLDLKRLQSGRSACLCAERTSLFVCLFVLLLAFSSSKYASLVFAFLYPRFALSFNLFFSPFYFRFFLCARPRCVLFFLWIFNNVDLFSAFLLSWASLSYPNSMFVCKKEYSTAMREIGRQTN